MLFGVGAFVNNTQLDPNTIFNKIINITNTTKFQDSMNIVLTIITAIGFVNVSFYTASGIFSWPIGLILSTSSISRRMNDVNDREMFLRMKVNQLQEKGRVNRLTPTEREQLFDAERELRELEREEAALTGYSNSMAFKLRKAIRPMQIIFGSLFGILSFILVVTLAMVNVDRILHGSGPKQGYVLLNPTYFNLLDYVCVKLNDLLFIGSMPILVITCFLAVATISGIRNLGLWFIFARLHRIKVGRTLPQALLYFCMTIMLAALAFNLVLYSMISQYVSFGKQNYRVDSGNGTWTVKECTMDNYQSDCILTRGSILLMRMMSQVWVFGAFFYWWSWAFVAVSIISIIAYLLRGRRQASHGIISEDEFED